MWEDARGTICHVVSNFRLRDSRSVLRGGIRGGDKKRKGRRTKLEAGFTLGSTLERGAVSLKLCTISFPSLRGPSILAKLSLRLSNWPSSFCASRAASRGELVTLKTPAILRSISPQAARSEPEWGVPKNTTPQVELRMCWYSASAPLESCASFRA
jgi:hypothetical protein